MHGFQAEKILQDMIRERDAFVVYSSEKISQLDAAIKALRTAFEGLPLQAGSADKDALQSAALTEVSPDFVGLAYPAAVHKALTLQPERRALTVGQIVEVLQARGVVLNAHNPRNTVKTALNRRKATIGDVVHTGLGEWGLRSWYTDSDLKKFEMGQTGAKARDYDLHIAKTKKGIEAAKARGAFYGRPPRLTEEMWNLAVRLMADEGKPMAFVYGEEPGCQSALYLRRKDFLARKPYPPRWRTYFETRKGAEAVKAEIVKALPKLRSVK
jgi:hypothetical protein